MDISNLLSEKSILLDVKVNSKEDLFELASVTFEKNSVVINSKKFKEDLYKREKETCTGIEDGFGIPHAKSKYVKYPALIFIKSNPILDYKALDDSDVECSFFIAVPKSGSDDHLAILSCLARKLMDEEFRNALKISSTTSEVLEIMNSF